MNSRRKCRDNTAGFLYRLAVGTARQLNIAKNAPERDTSPAASELFVGATSYLHMRIKTQKTPKKARKKRPKALLYYI